MKVDSAMEIGGEHLIHDPLDTGIDNSQLCRICANPNDYLIPIFQGEGLEHELKSKIAKHLPIKVSESDKLPTQLCYQCASTLIAWHDLVVACIEAEEKFNRHLKEEWKQTVEIKAETTKDSCTSKYSAETQSDEVVDQGNIDLEDWTEVVTENTLTESPDEGGKIIIEEVKTMAPESPEEVSTDSRWEEDINEIRDSQMIETCSSRESDGFSSDFESDEEFSTVYSCSICKASNMARAEFILHSRNHSKGEKRLALENVIVAKESEELAARKAAAAKGFKVQLVAGCSVTLYICTTCGQGNLLLKDLDQHRSTHPQVSESHYCHLCQQQCDNASGLDTHLRTHLENNDLICQFCNKKFTLIQDLELHETTHLQEEFVCIECRNSFKAKDLILMHFKKSHLVDSRCEICNLEFKTNSSINKHFMTHTIVNVINKTVNYFTCVFCQKEYGSKVSLQRHILFVHCKKTPYMCEQCGFTACNEVSLRKHVAVEHQDTGKLENLCRADSSPETDSEGKMIVDSLNHCNKSNDVDNFESNSTEEHCVLCIKTFKSKELLNIHLNVVHINKSTTPVLTNFPFQCTICNAEFKLEFELEDHSKLHNVTYQCHFCFKEFITDKSLQEHIAEWHYEDMETMDTSEIISSDECNTVESEILGL